MPCENPCFDCPFLKSADKIQLDDINEFVHRHLTEDGGYEEFICEEQNDVCIGWLQVITNGLQTGVEDFPHISNQIGFMLKDKKTYMQGAWEFLQKHD